MFDVENHYGDCWWVVINLVLLFFREVWKSDCNWQNLNGRMDVIGRHWKTAGENILKELTSETTTRIGRQEQCLMKEPMLLVNSQ